jgi:hypothetical protein
MGQKLHRPKSAKLGSGELNRLKSSVIFQTRLL